MRQAELEKLIAHTADPSRARNYWRQLGGLVASNPDNFAILLTILAGSQALAEQMIAHPDWLPIVQREHLLAPRTLQGVTREVNTFISAALASHDLEAGLARLREFKQKEMLRIAARDLNRLGTLPEILGEISNVADACLQAVFALCWDRAINRLGVPYHQDPLNRKWHPTEFCILGMGKLGGQELNYSSDIDVLFVYSEEGFAFKVPPNPSTPPGKGMSAHQFFNRLAETIIAEVGKMSAEGSLFRIDLRLRPEGKSGPLTRSLASYETYYAQWGQTWERMMLIKARPVAGNTSLGHEFLEMVQPFRYPRSPSDRLLREIAAVKDRIESEVVRAGEQERNVKLGRGGIREIEFIAQVLQVLHAGKTPFLQGAQTLPALKKLVHYRFLKEEDAAQLHTAYLFLRDLEHRLQMDHNQQTHTIPTERKVRERLSGLMGFEDLKSFELAHARHRAGVRRIYESILKPEGPKRHTLPEDFETGKEEWRNILERHGFRDLDHALKLAQSFINGPGFGHTSSRTVDLGMELMPRFLALCPKNGSPKSEDTLSDPDRVLTRLDSYVTAYGTRALLYESWTNNPSLFRLILWLFDRSEFLAEIAIRNPDLVDELEMSGRLRRQKTTAETVRDLQHGLKDPDQKLWIRKYREAELMRIGLRDILGLVDCEQSFAELTSLAVACLQYGLEVVQARRQARKIPIAIIGLGKLGGDEVSYGSDLDLLFVAAPHVKNLAAHQILVTDLLDLLSSSTERGIAFAIDTRLRPDGEKGLLLNSLSAFEEYYRTRAMLWEIQSLSRAKPVAGDESVGTAFAAMARRLTNFRPPGPGLPAFTPDWKQEIALMRSRIEKERTPAGKNILAIKTGTGGLMDAEFLAQVISLQEGWQEPNTLKALQKAEAAGIFRQHEGAAFIRNYRALRRVESILRRWSCEGEVLLPDDPAAQYRVAVRCGFNSAEEFLKEIGIWRAEIRAVYTQLMKL